MESKLNEVVSKEDLRKANELAEKLKEQKEHINNPEIKASIDEKINSLNKPFNK